MSHKSYDTDSPNIANRPLFLEAKPWHENQIAAIAKNSSKKPNFLSEKKEFYTFSISQHRICLVLFCAIVPDPAPLCP